MKFLTVLAALAAVAVANPLSPPLKCTPATYACATNPETGVAGWKVCDVTGTWVVSPVPTSPLSTPSSIPSSRSLYTTSCVS